MTGAQARGAGLRKRKIVVDRRQAAEHPLLVETGPEALHMPGTLVREGFQVEIAEREFGDYWISSPGMPLIIVESKTPDDLVASLRDGGKERSDNRMRHQLQGLLALQNLGAIPVIMTIGIVSLPGGKGGKNTGVMVDVKGHRTRRSYSYHEVYAALLAMQHLGVAHYPAPADMHTAATLRHIAEVSERRVHFEDPGLPQISMLGPKLSQLATALTSVPGVGSGTARVIAARYGTFVKFFTDATVKDLTEVPGVGKVLASRIYMAFHDQVADPAPGELDPFRGLA